MDVLVDKNVEATMRDGIVLRADVYRPAAEGRFPVLLLRTPYNKEVGSGTHLVDPLRAAAAGHVVIIQDVRGRWQSDGTTFYMFREEFEDGYDTVEWAAALPYSNGRVGEFGISYGANTSWQTAITAPPALKAIAPAQAPDYFLEGHTWLSRGGALSWGMIANWSLRPIGFGALARAADEGIDPTKLAEQLADDLDDYDRWIRHVPLATFPPARLDDPDFLPFFADLVHRREPSEWAGKSLRRRVSEVRAPAMIVGGWYDVLLGADLEYFQSIRDGGATEEARTQSRLLIGPWSHSNFGNVIGSVDFGVRAAGGSMDLREDLTTFMLRWFDRWLTDPPADGGPLDGEAEPRVRLFIQGVNRWRDFDDWPPPGVRPTPWYLQRGRALAPTRPPAGAGRDSYVYDPEDPCPSIGGGLTLPVSPPGPHDQRPLLQRRDVLAYTSAPLDDDLQLVGPVTMVLHAATSGPDTDWVAKLCQVLPDGRSLNLCDGILRASYRDGGRQPQPVVPGEVVRYEIDLWATGVVVPAGNRLQVLVTSSDFPRYDRNPNNGLSSAESADLVPALQTVWRDSTRPSHILLPVLP